MTARRSRHWGVIALTALFGLALVAGPVLAEGDPRPAPPQPRPSGGGSGGAQPSDTGGGKSSKSDKKKAKKDKRTEQEFYKGYTVGFNLIQAGRYEEAIAAFRALKQDDHPDVANYIGFANRKLGRYADAQHWYERALAADPKHVRTWQYYGMWHVEQGNMLKAQDYLATIRTLCGNESCKEFANLKGAMEGTVVY
jgi:tetratricopeptide (TPR) repeat protein